MTAISHPSSWALSLGLLHVLLLVGCVNPAGPRTGVVVSTWGVFSAQSLKEGERLAYVLEFTSLGGSPGESRPKADILRAALAARGFVEVPDHAARYRVVA